MPGATTVSKNRLELVKHFKQLGLPQTCDPSTRLTFDRLKAILLKPSTIHITQRLLCLACCSDVTPKDARTFLSAYIILCRPDMILQETPSSERIHLQAAAQQTLSTFENWLEIVDNPTIKLAEDFAAQYRVYVTLFEVWKHHDKQHLEAAIKAYKEEIARLRDAFATNDKQLLEGINVCIQEADRSLDMLKRS